MKSTSPQEYEENIKKYAKELCDYAVSGWLYARNSVVVAKNNVSGYPTNMTDQLLPLHDVTVKQCWLSEFLVLCYSAMSQ